MTDEVGHQVGIPVGNDLAGAIAAGDGGSRTDRPSTHGNLVVLFVFTGDVERNPLLVEEHGIVNQTFEDVEASGPSFRRGERLHLVFVFVGQAIEVVIGATNRFAGLATNPVMEVQLPRRVNGILNDDGHGLTNARRTGVPFFTVHRRSAQNKRRVAVQNEANGVVIGIGER